MVSLVAALIGSLAVIGAITVIGLIANTIGTSVAKSNAVAAESSCSTNSRNLLPSWVVKKVTGYQQKYHYTMVSTATVSHKTKGGIDRAYASFDPDFCGYRVGINGPNWKFVTTGQKDASTYDLAVLPGKIAEGVTCINNAPPVAKPIGNGRISIQMSCDRAYSREAEAYPDPVLYAVSPFTGK